MHKKRFSCALVICSLAISAVFISSTNATAIPIEYSGNIFQLSFEELIGEYPLLANYIDQASWPKKYEPNLEMEDGDPLPDFTNFNYLIIKQKNTSYIYLGDEVPTTWDELNGDGIRGISSYAAPVPEPATIILLGAGLLGLVGASRRKFKR